MAEEDLIDLASAPFVGGASHACTALRVLAQARPRPVIHTHTQTVIIP